MPKTIPERLKAYRERYRLTQAAMAARVGLVGPYAGNRIAIWERGEQEPTGLYLLAVEKLLSKEDKSR